MYLQFIFGIYPSASPKRRKGKPWDRKTGNRQDVESGPMTAQVRRFESHRCKGGHRRAKRVVMLREQPAVAQPQVSFLAGETLRVVNLRNGDRCDRNRKDGGAKEDRDDESGHFPSDGVQPIFCRKSLQLTADPHWSTGSVTWSGPLFSSRMITNRALLSSFQDDLRQRNSARRHLVISNSERLGLQTSRNFVREFNG